MLSTMTRPEDTIRVPRLYRDEIDDDNELKETHEPETPPHDLDTDALAKVENEIASRNGSLGGETSDIQRGTPRLLSPEEVVELAHRSVDSGIQETKRSLAGSEAVSDAVKPKLTIDLGHSNIGRIPEAVVDIIKDEVERLSLSNNLIFHIPYRFAECSHLRYLNIRANSFREFPRGVYKLPLLEILDLSRNKISNLPEEISKLTSLRVLSVMQNRLAELPLGLSDMNKLQILKIAGNPLRYPLRRVLEASEADIALSSMSDNEKEVAVTAELKRYLKARQPATPPDLESNGETSEVILDTPKPIKRGMGSRFPVIPSTGDNSSAPRPSAWQRPPQVPVRSHYRVVPGQGSYPRGTRQRIGANSSLGASERIRSNSEGIIQASVAARSKRMGVINRKDSDLGTLAEVEPYRNSHLRGLSHGSVLRTGVSGVGSAGNLSGSNSSWERRRQRDSFVSKISSLPGHSKRGETREPIIECAKSVLFALFQIQPRVSSLVDVINQGASRRSSLEILFYSACTHVNRLNEALENAERSQPGDPNSKELLSNNVLRHECETCIMAYAHVTMQLRSNVEKIVANSDTRYVRSLMLMVYGSLNELRNACMALGVPAENRNRLSSTGRYSMSERSLGNSYYFSGPTITPSRELPPSVNRLRSATTIQHPQFATTRSSQSTPSYQSAASSPGITSKPFSYGNRSRSSSRPNHGSTSVPSSLTTPRPGEPFPPAPSSIVSRINPLTGLDESEEEQIFGRIFQQLTSVYTAALNGLPLALRQFVRCLEVAKRTGESEGIQLLWSNLIRRCRTCIDTSEALGLQLSNMRAKEPGGGMRNHREFWQLCKVFMQAFVDLVQDMREVRSMQLLPSDIVTVLRPVQKSSREAGRLIEASPWSYLADMPPANAPGSIYGSPIQGHHPQLHSIGTMLQQSAQLPATPLSAALGPAAQATVPSTPASAYSDKFFEGDVFQRADSLLSMSNAGPFFGRR